jgi:hypothetical protein
VTHLRRIMLEELERRNYAPGTIRCYIRTVEHYAQHFRCPPDRLGPSTSAGIRRFISQVEAGAEHSRAAAGSSAFLLHPGAEQSCSVAETPYPKKVLHLPQILSQQEAARLIDAACRFPGDPSRINASERPIHPAAFVQKRPRSTTSPSSFRVQLRLQMSPRSIPIVIPTQGLLRGFFEMKNCGCFFMRIVFLVLKRPSHLTFR